MTRINVVPPAELYDQHLVAEYREIFMVGSSLQRSLKSPTWKDSRIPAKYTMGKGHVMFFYDKGLFLRHRFLALVCEMKARGMSPDPDRLWRYDQWPRAYFNDWTPSQQDLAVNRERIAVRLAARPGWYRKSSYLELSDD